MRTELSVKPPNISCLHFDEQSEHEQQLLDFLTPWLLGGTREQRQPVYDQWSMIWLETGHNNNSTGCKHLPEDSQNCHLIWDGLKLSNLRLSLNKDGMVFECIDNEVAWLQVKEEIGAHHLLMNCSESRDLGNPHLEGPMDLKLQALTQVAISTQVFMNHVCVTPAHAYITVIYNSFHNSSQSLEGVCITYLNILHPKCHAVYCQSAKQMHLMHHTMNKPDNEAHLNFLDPVSVNL